MRLSNSLYALLLPAFPLFAGAQEMSHLTPGRHVVGFQSVLEIDYSRPARNKAELGRAVQVNFWYPAASGNSPAMTFNDYLFLEAEEDSASSTKSKELVIANFLSYPASSGADTVAWRSFLKKRNPMKAKRSAAFKPGNYPVALLVHGSALQYSFLGEYLASHGMIVVSTPYKGYRQNTFDVSVLGMETEMRDAEYALDAVVRRLNTRPSAVGIVGISFGGQSAVGLAVRNPLVRCVVSLDGGIGSTFGPQLLQGHPFFSIERVNMPILHIYNPKDPGGNLDWFDVCQYADRYLVSLKNMDHSFFGIFGVLDKQIPYVLGAAKPRPGDNPEAILLFTETFLRAAFDNGVRDPEVISTLTRQHAWLSDGVESTTFRKKDFAPLPLEFWRGVSANKGIQGVIEAHQKEKAINAMPISDLSYRSLFLDSFNAQNKDAMTVIARLFAADFPASALARYYRGRAAYLNDQPAESRKFFQEALALIDGDRSMTAAEKETVKTRIASLLK